MKSKPILAGISLMIALEGIRYVSVLGSGRFGTVEAILAAVAIISLIGLEGVRRQNQKMLLVAGVCMIIMGMVGLLAVGQVYLLFGLLLIAGISYWKNGERTPYLLIGLSLAFAIFVVILSSFVWRIPSYAEVPFGHPLGEPTYVTKIDPRPIILTIFPILGIGGIHLKEQRVLWMAAIAMFLLCGMLMFSYGHVYLPSLLLLILAAIFFGKDVEGVSE